MNGPTSDDLAAELADVARILPTSQIRSWSRVLADEPHPGPGVEARLIAAHGGYGTVGLAARLMRAWRRHAPRYSGAAVGLALSAAAVTQDEAERRRSRLVVSGPVGTAEALLLTSAVVLDVIRAARESLLVVSFAAHGVRSVVRELSAAADRGVVIDLVLETTTELGGALRAGAGSRAFDDLVERARFWCWPAENRSGPAALHAKVVCSERTALLSSANLTDRGLADNVEIGALLNDPALVSAVREHFQVLMRPESHCLRRVEHRP